MTGLFDQSKHFADIRAPHVEHLIDALGLLEADDSGRSVDSCEDGLVCYELTQGTFRLEEWEVEEFGKTGKVYSGVVASDDSDVLRVG